MLIHLKQLVNSLAAVLIIVGTIANAKQIPITEEVELTIPVGNFSVVEFPFKVSYKNITSFMMAQDQNQKKEEKAKETITQQIAKPINAATKDKEPAKKKSKYISIEQNTNGFTFFPKKSGVLKMVVWGYEHPILLTIKASVRDGYGLYQFIEPLSKSKLVAKTEQGSHEEIINHLMVELFNQTTPKGYKVNSKDELLESNGFTLRLNRNLVGRVYLGQEWILTNNTKDEKIIHEESFYQHGIYAVSLEADLLKPSESIRVFIVRNNAQPR